MSDRPIDHKKALTWWHVATIEVIEQMTIDGLTPDDTEKMRDHLHATLHDLTANLTALVDEFPVHAGIATNFLLYAGMMATGGAIASAHDAPCNDCLIERTSFAQGLMERAMHKALDDFAKQPHYDA